MMVKGKKKKWGNQSVCCREGQWRIYEGEALGMVKTQQACKQYMRRSASVISVYLVTPPQRRHRLGNHDSSQACRSLRQWPSVSRRRRKAYRTEPSVKEGGHQNQKSQDSAMSCASSSNASWSSASKPFLTVQSMSIMATTYQR